VISNRVADCKNIQPTLRMSFPLKESKNWNNIGLLEHADVSNSLRINNSPCFSF